MSTQLQVIFIYRPHKVCTVVMSQLSEIFTYICSSSPATLLIGDFNIHVDSSRSLSAKLTSSINSFWHLHINFRTSFPHSTSNSMLLLLFFVCEFFPGHQVGLSVHILHMHPGPHADNIGQSMSTCSVPSYSWSSTVRWSQEWYPPASSHLSDFYPQEARSRCPGQ